MSVQQHNLQQVRQRLITRRDALTSRRRRVERDLARRNEPPVADFADQTIQLQNDEALQAIGRAAMSEILAIDEALARVERALYGVCKTCGGEIERARLLAIPHAVNCARCSGH